MLESGWGLPGVDGLRGTWGSKELKRRFPGIVVVRNKYREGTVPHSRSHGHE